MTGAATGAAVRAAVGAGAEEDCVGAVLMVLMSEDVPASSHRTRGGGNREIYNRTSYPTNWRDPLNCGGKGSGECARSGLAAPHSNPRTSGNPHDRFSLNARPRHASSGYVVHNHVEYNHVEFRNYHIIRRV